MFLHCAFNWRELITANAINYLEGMFKLIYSFIIREITLKKHESALLFYNTSGSLG